MSELHTLVAGLSWMEPAPTSEAPARQRPGLRHLATGVGAAMLGITGVGAAQVAVEVGVADWAADDAVADENMFNESAPTGTRYVMVPVTVSNVDGDSVTPRTAVQITFRAEDGRTFEPERQVVPRDLDELAPIAAGEAVTGNVLFALPADIERQGEWVVELATDPDEPLSFDAR